MDYDPMPGLKILAQSGAEKLCGYGNCIYKCYNCGHEKARLGGNPPLLNPNATCPVQKYQVENKGRPDWRNHKASDFNVTEDEIAALCACCDNGAIMKASDEYGDYWDVTRKDLHICMDCPVKTIEDSLAEMAAEARC